MNPTESDLRVLLEREAADVRDTWPALQIPRSGEKPLVAVAAGIVSVLAVVGAGVAIAEHRTSENRNRTAAAASSSLGADPKDGIGPAGTKCIRSASTFRVDLSALPSGVTVYHAAVGKPITVTITVPNPLTRESVASWVVGVIGPGTPTGDCALAATSKTVASRTLRSGTPLAYTFTPWEAGDYTVGVQGNPETAAAGPEPTSGGQLATSPTTPVLGVMVGVVQAS